MDLKQTLEYQQQVENYFEEHQVYELFDYLLKELMIDKPEDPLSYLISRLEKPPRRRFFIIGPTGSRKGDVAKELADRFRMDRVSVRELLKQEMSKNTDQGRMISECLKAGCYIPDEIVLQLLFPVLQQMEEKGVSYILEGAPRTRVQSLALQEAGVVPDRLICFQLHEEEFASAARDKFVQVVGQGKNQQERSMLAQSLECSQMVEQGIQEFQHYIQGVSQAYGSIFHEIQGIGDIDKQTNRAVKIFMMKGKGSAPRKPPRIVMVGPPGTGRTSQAALIAQRYGLILVSSADLLKEQVKLRTVLGNRIAQTLTIGQLVPDEIISELVRSRLIQSDCQLNGWVLDGYPRTLEQAHSLRSFRIQPTHVFFLEANEALIYERLEQRKIDPITGQFYNSNEKVPEFIKTRLTTLPQDEHDVIKRRLDTYRENATKLQAEYARISHNIKAELDLNLITDMIGDAIENSISLGY